MRTSARILLAVLLTVAAGCSPSSDPRSAPELENTPPEIERIEVEPSRIHRFERGTLRGIARDPDGDRIFYRWSARRGTFPLDQRNPQVPYIAPLTGVADTVSLLVFDAEDSTAMDRVVNLTDLAPPRNLNVAPGPSWAEVTWEGSIDERLFDFTGYEVFAADTSLQGLSDEELAQFLRTPDPSPARSFRVHSLQVGTIYYFLVRALRGTGEVSARTGEKDTSPRPQGIAFSMREFKNPSSSPKGFDLSAGGQIEFSAESPSNVDQIDFYLGTTDPEDGPGDLQLKSPEFLASYNPVWSQRQVGFKALGKDWAVGETDTIGFSSSVIISDTLVVAIHLPEGQFAKVQITEIQNSHPYRQIQFLWAYQTIPGYAKF